MFSDGFGFFIYRVEIGFDMKIVTFHLGFLLLLIIGLFSFSFIVYVDEC